MLAIARKIAKRNVKNRAAILAATPAAQIATANENLIASIDAMLGR